LFKRQLAELESELNIVAVNMKNLEISEQEALTRDEALVEQINDMAQRLKQASSFRIKYLIYHYSIKTEFC